MKKIPCILIIAILIIAFTGCGARDKMEEKIAEKVIEQAIGANVELDGDEVTIKTDEGVVTIGSSEWPDSELSSKIPELKKGKIASVMNSEAYLLVIIEEVELDDFLNYYEDVKAGFSQESYDTKNEDMLSYMGKNEDGISIMASYSTEDGTVSISASLPE